jgi:hypothetical protein
VTHYEHTQIGYLMIVTLFLAAGVVAGLGAIVQGGWIAFVIAAILFLTTAAFYRLTIKIDDQTLRASFGMGLIRRTISLEQIVDCEPIRIRWWYGWGIHLTPYGWLYNISGWDAVAITLRCGRKLSLGTDDPQGLVAAIRRFASAK